MGFTPSRDVEEATYVERSGAAQPQEGSVHAELLMMAQAIEGLQKERSELHVEIGNLRDRIAPVLDLEAVEETRGVLATPGFGSVSRSEVATEIRRLTSIMLDLLGELDVEVDSIRSIRQRVAL